MYRFLVAPSPRELMKWCAYALVLLTPGSFVVLPVLWVIRHLWFRPRAGKGDFQEAGYAGLETRQ